MRKQCFFDTETCGFQGPTVLIQYQFDDEEIVLMDIFFTPAQEVLDLIDEMLTLEVIGFNLVFDFFHLARTYNILSFAKDKSKPLSQAEYFEIERVYGDPQRPLDGLPSIYDICLKPYKVLDLMILGREHELQSTMNRSPIYIRKVPRQNAEFLLAILKETMSFDPIYFARRDGLPEWKIVDIYTDGTEVTAINKKTHTEEDISKDLCSIRLNFYPSTGLKAITKYILKKRVIEYDVSLKSPKEKPYYPIGGDYKELLPDYIHMWRTDEWQRKYAKDDVVNTRLVYEHFDTSDVSSTNHELAVLVGNTYWSGYSIDNDLVDILYKKALEKKVSYLSQIQYSSPAKCLEWLKDACPNKIMASLLTSTAKASLEPLLNRTDLLGERANVIWKGRRVDKEVNLLTKLKEVKRFHASFNIVGTKSNRMSGGSLVSAKGSINPQGIGKKSGLRGCFTFKDAGQVLVGGDFSGFEVAIMEAVYGDEHLREQLTTGKKFHAIFGAFMYGKTYEEILADKELYARAKSGVFGWAYGGQAPTIAETLGIQVEDAQNGLDYMEATYAGIGDAKKKLYLDYECMVQGENRKIEWKEPKKFVESFLGFRRYFEMEYGTIRTMFLLANEIPHLAGEPVERTKDRPQSQQGAIRSALYASAFNMQASILRVCSNHKIQAVGGQMTKELQANMFKLQPVGATKWKIKIFNVHDEVQVAVAKDLAGEVAAIKDKYILDNVHLVPLLDMDWNQDDCKSWEESH